MDAHVLVLHVWRARRLAGSAALSSPQHPACMVCGRKSSGLRNALAFQPMPNPPPPCAHRSELSGRAEGCAR
eukprot:38457-Chlamydomonas_euryale.AAC.5